MPQASTIVLNDGTADHSFKPDVVNEGGLSVFIENHTSGQLNLARRLTLSKRTIQSKEGGTRVQVRLSKPKTSTNSSTGEISVIGTDTVALEFTTRPVSNSTLRAELVAELISVLSNADVQSVLINQENIYG